MKRIPTVIVFMLAICLTCSVYAKQTQKKRANRTEKKSELATIDSTRYQISVISVEGDSEEGIDIADLKEHKLMEEDLQDKPFSIVEQMPSFPGGDSKMMAFIKDSLRYPVVAAESGLQGRVVVRFVVDKEGAIKDATILRGFDPSCEKEALRIVKSMPRWIPGKQNNQAVDVYYNIPVLFRLVD